MLNNTLIRLRSKLQREHASTTRKLTKIDKLERRRSAKLGALLNDAPVRGSGLCARGLHRIYGPEADIYVSSHGKSQCGACTREREKRKRRERKAAA